MDLNDLTVVIEKETDRDYKCSIINREGTLIAEASLIEIREMAIYHAVNIKLLNEPWEPPS